MGQIIRRWRSSTAAGDRPWPSSTGACLIATRSAEPGPGIFRADGGHAEESPDRLGRQTRAARHETGDPIRVVTAPGERLSV